MRGFLSSRAPEANHVESVVNATPYLVTLGIMIAARRRGRTLACSRARRQPITHVEREDCAGATDHGNHLAAIKMVTMQGGVFGAVGRSAAFVEAVTGLS